MKNLIEILGGAQRLLGLSFDPDVLFEERLTAEHRGFLSFLRVVEEYLPRMNTKTSRFGRPRYDDVPIFRAILAKHIYQIDKNNRLRQRLLSDSSLRKICGFAKVPSEATFSRRLEEFAKTNLPEAILAPLVHQYHEGSLARTSHHRDFCFGKIDEEPRNGVYDVYTSTAGMRRCSQNEKIGATRGSSGQQSRANHFVVRQFPCSHTLKYAPRGNCLSSRASTRSCCEKFGLELHQGLPVPSFLDSRGVRKIRRGYPI